MSAHLRRDPLLAAASGLVLGAAFLPVPLGFLGWFALVPLLGALERRVEAGVGMRGLFALGYVGGLAFFLTGTHWLALLSEVAITSPWLKYVAWLAASAYLAMFWGVAVMLAGWVSRRSGVPARWTFAAAMLLVEELRGSGEMGFPWFQPGYSQHSYVPILALAALGSVTLVTLWLLLLNAALRHAIVQRTPARLALVVGLLVSPWASALVGAQVAPMHAGPNVALVQGNIPGDIKWAGHHQREILNTFLALSDSAARMEPPPVLIVWPETATGSYLRKQVDQSIAMAEFAARHRVTLFSGFADYEYRPDGTPMAWNAAGQWNADGSLSEVYPKRHLVPFGERIPFQAILPALGKIDFGQAEWMPGARTVLFPSQAGPFSCLVCFESIFPDLARHDVNAGARFLVNITNDEWFGKSAALDQHAAMAAFRAAENAVPLVRCANTGLTQLIDSRGRVMARVPAFSTQILNVVLPPSGPRTLYSRLGDWPGLLAALAIALLLLAPWRRRSALDFDTSKPPH
ncbi:MAG: apolipoprotein N-acyltransferase [Candidatus Eisenbacteria bacterium]